MAVRGARRSLVLLLALAAVLALTLACIGSGEDDRVAAPAPPTASATAAESATPAPVATPTRAATAAPTPAPAVTPTATVVALPAPTPTATATRTPTVVATPATRCATTTAADCIRAVYRGAPGDYVQVADIPAAALLTPDADGRYQVERGQQVTVVTAAPLPAGWTRFYLQQTPIGTPSPVSTSQLSQGVGTTYTFTVTEDEAASTLLTFDLKPARPFVRPRPDGQAGDRSHRRDDVFSVETSSPRYSSYDTTGAVATAGSYAFLIRRLAEDDGCDERSQHLRGAARRHHDGAADPQVRRPRRLAGRALRRRGDGRSLRVARGRRLLGRLPSRGSAPGSSRYRAAQTACGRAIRLRVHGVRGGDRGDHSCREGLG